jgi:isoleucyl-tRNA synthetase
MLFEKYGADAVRWCMAKTVVGNSMTFNESEVRSNSVINRLLNCLTFYQTYAKIDNVGFPLVRGQLPIDLWVCAACNDMADGCLEAYQQYEFAVVCEKVDRFVDQLSNIWLRANRERFWNTDGKGVDIHAYAVLGRCIRITCKVIAPIMPFLADHVFRLLSSNVSVHLEDFPQVKVSLDDTVLLRKMEQAQAIIVEGRRQRDEKAIKLRQPLRTMNVPAALDLEGFEGFVKTELNVKSLVRGGEEVSVNTTLDDDLIAEGLAREFIRVVQVLRKESGFDVTDRITLTVDYRGDTKLKQLLSSRRQEVATKLLVLEWKNEPVDATSKVGESSIGIKLERQDQ